MELETVDLAIQPTVFIVDDDEAVRSGIADLIEAMGLRVQTFGSAEEFVSAYDPAMPGCLVLDMQMPGMSGLELQTAFVQKGIHLPVIIITGHGDVTAAVTSMKLGAVDFLQKPFREQVLSECIQKAIVRDAQIRSRETEGKQIDARLGRLTARERQIMELMITGKADKEIGLDLSITQRAVSFHRLHIMAKMQVSSVAELTALAAKAGLLK